MLGAAMGHSRLVTKRISRRDNFWLGGHKSCEPQTQTEGVGKGCPKNVITPTFGTTRLRATVIQTIASKWLRSLWLLSVSLPLSLALSLSLVFLIFRKLLQSLGQAKENAQTSPSAAPRGAGLGWGVGWRFGEMGPALRARRKRAGPASCGGSGRGAPRTDVSGPGSAQPGAGEGTW